MALNISTIIFALTICHSAFAGLSGDSLISLDQVCDKNIANNSFRNKNQGLCAEADRLEKDIQIPLVLACLNIQFQSLDEICPQELFSVVDFPEMPYTLANFPTWDDSIEPVLDKIMGSSIAASGKAKVAKPLLTQEYGQDVVRSFCLDEANQFAKTDRILCAPYLPQLALEDPFSPEKIYTTTLYFDSGSTHPQLERMFRKHISTRIAAWGLDLERQYGIQFDPMLVKVASAKAVGYADKTGNSAANYDVSVERASSVAYILRSFFHNRGIRSIRGEEWVPIEKIGRGDRYSSSCYDEKVRQVCVTEDAHGNFLRGRRGRRPSQGRNDRCYNDENGYSGWVWEKRKVCPYSDRRVEVELKFVYGDQPQVSLPAR